MDRSSPSRAFTRAGAAGIHCLAKSLVIILTKVLTIEWGEVSYEYV